MAHVRVSLANKCQLLFGLAVVLILTAALAVPWLRMQKLVDESQLQIARRLGDAWVNRLIELGGNLRYPASSLTDRSEGESFRFTLIEREQFDLLPRDSFVAEAVERFESQPPDDEDATQDLFETEAGSGLLRSYRYVRAIRQSDLDQARSGFASSLPATQVADPLRAVLVLQMNVPWVGRQILLNRIYIVVAGLLAGLLAIVTFWFITTRIILSPVRVLRSTAEKVSEGDLNIRADINTGDEFEQLSDAFNEMLANLKSSQEQLRALNKQLDLKLGELAETNVSLYEANRIKTDFLANVSHELRTPLNSIIGFAEVLQDQLDGAGPDEKQRRYIHNILTSSRSLLTMINELLDLAKIEAGRIDLHVESMSVSDACEGLINLIRPQAEARQQTLALNVEREIPLVKTDPGKFQQVLFNFLSNAVKFTPEGGRIELGAEAERDGDGRPVNVRVWVSDTGPGIPLEAQELVFEKFRQLDETHTKLHAGTGLGLAISRELARVLEGRIELDSDVGRGATFTLVIPLVLESKSQALMPN